MSGQNTTPPVLRKGDLTGKVFGRLTVVGLGARNRWGKLRWECRCVCGKTTLVARPALISGKIKSCGCWRKDMLKQRCTTHGEAGGRHDKKTPEYSAWVALNERCRNQSAPHWKDYGGRGITVCERWRSFENFLADMGRKPGPAYEIERLDNDKGYEPGNCVWATRKEQTRNTRRTHSLTFNGITLCITDWAKRQSLHVLTLHKRLRLGWSVERALTEPVMSRSEAARRAAQALHCKKKGVGG